MLSKYIISSGLRLEFRRKNSVLVEVDIFKASYGEYLRLSLKSIVFCFSAVT